MKFFIIWVISLSFAAPVFFLSVGGWISGCYILLFLSSLAWAFKVRPEWDQQDKFVAIVLASPIAAVLIGQLLRWDWHPQQWDAPVRLFAGIPVYLMFKYQIGPHVENTKRVLSALIFGSALGLIFLPLFVNGGRTLQYENRVATLIADPNTLGSYIGVLFLFVCAAFFGVTSSQNVVSLRSRWSDIAVLGAVLGVGLILLIFAQSRGAILAWTIAYLVMATILYRDRLSKLAIAVFVPLILATTVIACSDHLRTRFSDTASELVNWIGGKPTGLLGSGGVRLDMITATSFLVKESPLSGYGDLGYSKRLQEDDFKTRFRADVIETMSLTGPHQEILARTLQSGLWGLGATLLLFFGPIMFFVRKIRSAKNEQLFAAQIGLVFCCQLLILQFTIEPYSLKFTTTFNAFILSMLFGITNAKRPVSRK